MHVHHMSIPTRDHPNPGGLSHAAAPISSSLLWSLVNCCTRAAGVCTLLGALCHRGLLPAMRSTLPASPKLSPLRQAAGVRPPLPLPGI